MTARSCYSHLTHVSSEPIRILLNSGAATADSTAINEANFAAQFAERFCADNLCWYELDILPEQAVDNYVENKSHDENFEEEKSMTRNELSKASSFGGRFTKTYVVWFVKHTRNMIKEG